MKKFKVVYVEEVCNSYGAWVLHRNVVEILAKNKAEASRKVRMADKDPIHIEEM